MFYHLEINSRKDFCIPPTTQFPANIFYYVLDAQVVLPKNTLIGFWYPFFKVSSSASALAVGFDSLITQWADYHPSSEWVWPRILTMFAHPNLFDLSSMKKNRFLYGVKIIWSLIFITNYPLRSHTKGLPYSFIIYRESIL